MHIVWTVLATTAGATEGITAKEVGAIGVGAGADGELGDRTRLYTQLVDKAQM